jgi:hypothetical protein
MLRVRQSGTYLSLFQKVSIAFVDDQNQQFSPPFNANDYVVIIGANSRIVNSEQQGESAVVFKRSRRRQMPVGEQTYN